MASAFSEQAFEQKLVNLKDTQESINAMSTWCIKNKEHHKKIVICWLHCLKRVKIDQRLSLFYLANDVIQYSKRKHLDFVNSWGTALQKATTLVRDDKVRHRVMRIFKIWEERGVYDEVFITDLCGLLTTSVKKKEPEITDPEDFQPTSLIKKIRECCLLEENTDSRYRRVQEFKLPLTDAESMRMQLKDRRHGSDVVAEVDSGVRKMEAYVKALETEISSREKLIDILRQAMIFYENQRGEAKIVANAYKNFGGRLRAREKALEEIMPTLLSPLPSPDVNAPSPSPDPEDVPHSYQQPPAFNGSEMDFSFSSSFLGSSQVMDLYKDVFTSEPPPDHDVNQKYNESVQDGGQSIQVIGTRAEPDQSFNVAEFLKSLMPLKENPLPPPPMPPPVFGDWSSGMPWEEPPPETPQSPPMYEKQVPHVQPLEYDDSLPVAPIPDVDHRTLMSMHSENNMHPPHDRPQLSNVDTDHRLPPPPVGSMDGPPPPLGLDLDHRLQMEYPPVMMLEPPPRMDVPPPMPLEHLPPDRMDQPPPMQANPPDHHNIMMEPPPHMRLEPPPNPPDLDLLNHITDHLRMDHPPPMRMEPPPNPPDLDQISHLLGNIPDLAIDRGAILAGPPKKLPQKVPVDVDRRNLISLTPREPVLQSSLYGEPPRFGKDVNVETVDMDVSEEDDDESQARSYGDGGDRRFHGGSGPRRPGPLQGGGPQMGPRFRNTPPNIRNPNPDNELSNTEPDLEDMGCVGAKLIPPAERLPTPDRNGHPGSSLLHRPGEFGPRPRGGDFSPRPRGDFSPRPRWRGPRPHTPYRTPSPFRGNFRPRGRW